jgi:Glycosyl transferases group 1
MRETSHPQVETSEITDPARLETLKVGFSCNLAYRHVTEKYLSDTFDPGYAIQFDLDRFKPNVSLFELLDMARSRREAPDIFAHLVHTPGLPRDIQRSPIPTVSLDIDSFAWTSSRVRWSMLFDYVFVWHLSLAPLYQEAGHPKVFVLPHAVDAKLFPLDTGGDRPLDLGWVGGFGYAHYDNRRRIVGGLADRFKMNDFSRRYSKTETAEVYRASKIVVNVSRGDFPQEANMRCYEAMAAGALLITGMPTELTEWGFREGEHFVGWRSEAEISELVGHYLEQGQQRAAIARAGQELTLSNFTFQKCRDKMAAVLREHPGEFFAPARNWPEADVRLLYLEYYYRYQQLAAALEEFKALKQPGAYLKGFPMILKTMRHRVKARV